MDRYQTNDGFEIVEDLRRIFEKANKDGWAEDDLMDAINDAMDDAGYDEDGFFSGDDGS
jgi:hypothetical protein